MRTKQGDENSYISDDSINAIDLTYKDTYNDVYKVYKGLIALRKANYDAFGANAEANAEKANDNGSVIKYTAGNFMVYFNSADSEFTIDTAGYTKVVDVTSGAVTESTTLPATVAAKSFVILKK
jgi:pullulanase